MRKHPKIIVDSAAYLLNAAYTPEIPAIIHYYLDVREGKSVYRVTGTAWQTDPPHVVVSTLHATALPWRGARNKRLVEIVRDLITAYLHTKEYADAFVEFQRGLLVSKLQERAYVVDVQARELQGARESLNKARRDLAAFNRKHPQ